MQMTSLQQRKSPPRKICLGLGTSLPLRRIDLASACHLIHNEKLVARPADIFARISPADRCLLRLSRFFMCFALHSSACRNVRLVVQIRAYRFPSVIEEISWEHFEVSVSIDTPEMFSLERLDTWWFRLYSEFLCRG